MTEMTCAAAQEEMLVAELAELRGEGDTDLAKHIRGCAKCAARAEAILRAYGKLGESLAAMKPETTVIPLKKRRPLRWLPLPLAAAAVVALLLARQQEDILPNVDALAGVILKKTPVVAPRAGQQAMVIEKSNMTIVWLYK
jgi:hypothetical protein